MKIAFLHPFLLRYARGIERYTVNLASALARTGAQVDLLTWRWPHELAWDELHVSVRVRSIPTPRYYSAWFAWLPYLLHLRREHYDHVFVYFADYGEGQVLSLSKGQAFSMVLLPPGPRPDRCRSGKTA